MGASVHIRPFRAAWLLGLAMLVPAAVEWYKPSRRDDPSRSVRVLPALSPSDGFTRMQALTRIPIRPLSQGQTNGCGTASLAMVLNALIKLKHPDAVPIAVTQVQLDEQMRALDSFSSPDRLAEVALDYGVLTTMLNNSTFSELAEQLDQGHPVIALVKASRDSEWSFHYVVIHDYADHPDPAQRMITITDPAWGWTYRTSYDRFNSRYADDLKLGGVSTGYNRFILAFSTEDDLPPNRQVPLVNWAVGAANTVINTVADIRTGLAALVVSILLPRGQKRKKV